MVRGRVVPMSTLSSQGVKGVMMRLDLGAETGKVTLHGLQDGDFNAMTRAQN